MLASLLLSWQHLVSTLSQLLVSFSLTTHLRCSLIVIFLDADPYIPGGNGAQFYVNQNNLYVPPALGLHHLILITLSQLPFRQELCHRPQTVRTLDA